MNKILVLGSISHEAVDTIEWTKPFVDFENYDILIIDLSSFPKDFPTFLFKNIGFLKRISRLFIRDYKEIFCILEKPFKILFKEIPLNYSWIPFPQKLTVNPMLLGKTIINIDERFSEYIKNVEKWDNELFWEKTNNCTFNSIAVNKSNNSIAATITIGGRGKIHFLPKTTKIHSSRAIELLIDIINKNKKNEKNSSSIFESKNIVQFEKNDNKNKLNMEISSNLFSVDMNLLTKAAYSILNNLGISESQSIDLGSFNLKNCILVEIIDAKRKIEFQNPRIKHLAKIIEIQKNKRKIFIWIRNKKQQGAPG